MRLLKSLDRLVVRFAVDRGGNFIILLALALIPLLGGIGIAIDSARGYLVKTKLSNALDAAGLAAARNVNPDDIASDLQRYFAANFPDGYLGATVQGPEHTLSDGDTVINLNVSATIETSFAKVIGFNELGISASAQVARAAGLADIVLSIDMSGSMGESAGDGQSRIAAARVAAKALVDHLFGNQDTKAGIQIGLVPWNSKVNVATNGVAFDPDATTPDAIGAFVNPINDADQSEVYYADNSEVPLLFQPPNDWNGCVFARYYHDGSDLNDGDTSYGPDSFGDKDWPAWEPVGGLAASEGSGGASKKKKKKKKKKSSSAPGSYGSSEDAQCLDHGVTPMQSSKSAIKDAIDELTSPTGNTVIAQGLAWAWRVLMPDAPFTDADPDANPVPFRAVVLLTDGSHCGSEWDAYKGELGDCSGSRTELNDRLKAIAAKMKAEGIKVIAIQFANDGTDLETLMKQVASGDEAPYYYHAPDGDALKDVFEEIASHIGHVRLTR